jgi:plastocyanin
MGARPRERRARLLFAVPLVLALVLLPAAASSAEPTIEAAAGAYGSYYWSPSSAQTAPGGTVTFKNPSGSVLHGVTWSGGPETPNCSNVPINDGKTSWTGSCTFAQAGTYSFYCSVHPTEMKGTITASSAGTGTNPPPPGPPGSQPGGPALQALNIAKDQRGTHVKGSVDVSQAGAGGRLQVDLFATRAKLFGPGHPGRMRVGRLTRSSLSEGHVSFTVSLKGVARRALHRDERLPLQVKVTVTPPQGDALRRTRAVILHA